MKAGAGLFCLAVLLVGCSEPKDDPEFRFEPVTQSYVRDRLLTILPNGCEVHGYTFNKAGAGSSGNTSITVVECAGNTVSYKQGKRPTDHVSTVIPQQELTLAQKRASAMSKLSDEELKLFVDD